MGKKRLFKRVVPKERELELVEKNLKRLKTSLNIRSGIPNVTECLRQVFHGELNAYSLDWISAASDPFPTCQISDLFYPSDSVSELEEECARLELKSKTNDLFQFHQSGEIMALPDEQMKIFTRISEFRESMKNFMPLMTAISGYEITSMSLFYAEYKYTDHLLPHEDDLENRVIAFVYYLNSDDWIETDGGYFDSYESDDKGQPIKVHGEWLPKRNHLNFFRVTDSSFHQVREVISEMKVRKSLSGWFHTSDPIPPRVRAIPQPPAITKKEFNRDVIDYRIEEWISEKYLVPDTMGDIQVQFEDTSEIQLEDILNPKKYEKILECLENSKFEKRGPFHRKKTLELAEQEMFDDSPLGELMKFLTSDHFFLLLSNWTGLKLHPEAPVDDEDDEEEDEDEVEPTGGSYRCQVRKWEMGNYTLLHDADTYERGSLDMFMYFFSESSAEISVDGWDIRKGGAVSYITKGEDEELLTVCPKANTLSLVFRDASTLRFSNYLNKKTANNGFYDVFNSYYE